MGLSLYFFWNEKLPVVKADLPQVKIISKKKGYLYFGAQLLLNFLWSYFFFKLHSPFLAFVDILLLIAAIVLTMFHFNKVTAKAALILIPYLLWVCFATYLNFSIIRLN
ncbi:MAG: tryptophan-rich sensory protein, partial [Fimbriimonadaceae bacterium]|nr:tryptophan-rich sensory protein [Chitinophagales bacterium]